MNKLMEQSTERNTKRNIKITEVNKNNEVPNACRICYPNLRYA